MTDIQNNSKAHTHTHALKIGFVVHVGFEPITMALTWGYFRKAGTVIILIHQCVEPKSTSALPTYTASPSADAEPQTGERGSKSSF